MAVKDTGAASTGFVSLKSPKGHEWMGKDSGEAGMQLQESRKGCVPNPECTAQPVPMLRKTGK